MKKIRFNPVQIAGILKVFDDGKSADEITRDHGVNKASLYKWRQLYGGIEVGFKEKDDGEVGFVLKNTGSYDLKEGQVAVKVDPNILEEQKWTY